jgi:hypothetical protein
MTSEKKPSWCWVVVELAAWWQRMNFANSSLMGQLPSPVAM